MSEGMQYLQLTATPPTISLNYEEMKERLEKQLADYDVVVTEDNLAEAKKMATELNQQAEYIKRERIDRVREVTQPIRVVEDQLKELTTMTLDVRQRIIDQIKAFEQKRLKLCHELLGDLRSEEWGKLEVQDEFRRAEVQDLVKLGSLTKADRLAKAAREAVIERVNQDAALQNRTEKRLLQLENRCHQVNLSAPLQRHNVEHFLFDDDDIYEEELEALIQTELRRQMQIEARAIADKSRKEQAERQAAEMCHQQAEELPPENTQAPPPREPEAPPPSEEEGKVAWRVTAVFDVTVSDKLTESDLKRGLRKVMASAGFKSLKDVSATRQESQP